MLVWAQAIVELYVRLERDSISLHPQPQKMQITGRNEGFYTAISQRDISIASS